MGAVERLPEPEPDDDVTPTEALEGEVNPHVLVLGDEVFTCADDLPYLTMVRYASGGFEQVHHLMLKLVPEDEHERFWDAWEEMPSFEVAMESVTELMTTYSDRPTDRPSRSSRGSKRTKRK